MKRRVILNFHGLGKLERPLEPGEAPYWVEPDFLSETLALADRLSETVDTSLTFDDGNSSDLEIAADLLARHGRTASFFVLAGRLGRQGSRSVSDVRELFDAGHQIGSHGHGHVNWKGLDEAGQRREWREARECIADAIGEPVSEAAIPFGRYDRGVLQGLRRAGFLQVYSSDGGSCGRDPFPFPRTSVRADMDLGEIEAILLGRESMRDKYRRRLAMAVKKRL